MITNTAVTGYLILSYDASWKFWGGGHATLMGFDYRDNLLRSNAFWRDSC